MQRSLPPVSKGPAPVGNRAWHLDKKAPVCGEKKELYRFQLKWEPFKAAAQRAPLCAAVESATVGRMWLCIFFFAACNVCINQEAANRYNGDTKVLQTISMQQHQKIGCNNTNWQHISSLGQPKA